MKRNYKSSYAMINLRSNILIFKTVMSGFKWKIFFMSVLIAKAPKKIQFVSWSDTFLQYFKYVSLKLQIRSSNNFLFLKPSRFILFCLGLSYDGTPYTSMYICIYLCIYLLLEAKLLYKRLCLSVCLSVGWSVCRVPK